MGAPSLTQQEAAAVVAVDLLLQHHGKITAQLVQILNTLGRPAIDLDGLMATGGAVIIRAAGTLFEARIEKHAVEMTDDSGPVFGQQGLRDLRFHVTFVATPGIR